MWVWSDELFERVSGAKATAADRVPLVAYAVASESDLDEMAREIVARTSDGDVHDRRVSSGERISGR